MRNTVIGDLTLESVMSKRGVWVLVAFMYYGSIPCRFFRPEFRKISEHFGRKLWHGEINAEENPTITDTLKVVAVPTTLLLYNGVVEGRYEGPYSHEALIERIDRVLKAKA